MERTNSKEHRKSNVIRAALLAGGLSVVALLAGCGQSSTDRVDDAPKPEAKPTVTYEYFSDGTRQLKYTGSESKWFATIFESCDGPDLVEQTEYSGHGYGGAGNDIERSVNHPACVDGKLTESDFKIAK
jgi:hypothetical protein